VVENRCREKADAGGESSLEIYNSGIAGAQKLFNVIANFRDDDEVKEMMDNMFVKSRK